MGAENASHVKRCHKGSLIYEDPETIDIIASSMLSLKMH